MYKNYFPILQPPPHVCRCVEENSSILISIIGLQLVFASVIEALVNDRKQVVYKLHCIYVCVCVLDKIFNIPDR